MKRFWLFGGPTYYSVGGMMDFIGSFDSVAPAADVGKLMEDTDNIDWWHVFDVVEKRICLESEFKPYGYESACPNFEWTKTVEETKRVQE